MSEPGGMEKRMGIAFTAEERRREREIDARYHAAMMDLYRGHIEDRRELHEDVVDRVEREARAAETEQGSASRDWLDLWAELERLRETVIDIKNRS